MTTTAECPVCHAPQQDGIACSNCCTRLEDALAQVPGLVAELNVAISRQAKIGTAGKGGLASERANINWGAASVLDDLNGTLTTWATEVTGDPIYQHRRYRAGRGARILLSRIDLIRRHTDVATLVDEIHDAINQARRAIDRPADKQYLGQCLVPHLDQEGREVTCIAEVYARHGASQATCGSCGITHDTIERRAKMLQDIKGMIFTVREASYLLGEVGDIKVSQASIRGYIHRGKLAYRPGTIHGIRLGDLLTVVLDEGERRSA